MEIQELIGQFAIQGSNQEESTTVTYRGTHLAIDHNNRIVAHWQIGKDQEQFGHGFFKDNILVINFYYYGDEEEKLKGIAVYRCITEDILEGFWSEKHGDPLYLGMERCLRLDTSEISN